MTAHACSYIPPEPRFHPKRVLPLSACSELDMPPATDACGLLGYLHHDRALSVGHNDPSAIDPDGRHVVLDERTIQHLQTRRPQMAGQVDTILQTVSRPDRREEDPVPGRERFYLQHVFTSRWLRVVVDFSESPAFIVTAFVQDNAPGTKP
jgi:hypothetical protein